MNTNSVRTASLSLILSKKTPVQFTFITFVRLRQMNFKDMVTINSTLDDIMKLDFTSREMLLEILEKRQVEARREQMAKDAKKSIRDYRKGHTKPLSFKEAIKRLETL